MLDYVSGAVRVSLVTFALCGFAYPLAVTGVGQLFMPYRTQIGSRGVCSIIGCGFGGIAQIHSG